MKKNYIFGIANFSNGIKKMSRNYVDKEAFSRWANAQFRKDEQVHIEEYEMSAVDFSVQKTADWRA